MQRRAAAALVSLALASPLLLLTEPAHAAPSGTPARPYDVDGDGFPEQVVGAPHLQVRSLEGAGGVFVLPASAKGLSTSARTITSATSGVAGAARAEQAFGSAFASADFDRDGYADLAVGAPGTRFGSSAERGTVTILFGSAKGLTGARSYVLTRAGDAAEDGFGSSLAVADLDSDGWADLAVGAPYADRVELPEEDYPALGSVTVLDGGAEGFSTARSTVLHGSRAARTYDLLFGSSLAVGDVDRDDAPDLVVVSRGQAYEDGDGHPGSVSVCPGGAACSQIPAQPGYAGLESLAVGNVSGSSRPEIVVGVVPDPHEEAEQGGSVWTLSLSGTGSGITAKATQLDQDRKGVPGSNEVRDAFGSALAIGDVDRDGYADLVVGSPGEAIGSREHAGRVTLVRGGRNGYRTSGNKAYDQDTTGIPGRAEPGDRFGAAVSLLDHDRDGRLDLTVGAPGENESGAVTTLRGSGTSFTTKGSMTFGLATLRHATRADADFGAALGR